MKQTLDEESIIGQAKEFIDAIENLINPLYK